MNNSNDPLNGIPSRYVRLRCVPATALNRGFEDRVLEVQNISSIERYPDFPTFAIVLTFQGVAFITSHNFDELTKEFNPISVNSGGDRLEEKLLAGEGARQAKLLAEAEAKAELKREAEKMQLDADGKGEVISLDEARARLQDAAHVEAEAQVEALEHLQDVDAQNEEEFRQGLEDSALDLGYAPENIDGERVEAEAQANIGGDSDADAGMGDVEEAVLGDEETGVPIGSDSDSDSDGEAN